MAHFKRQKGEKRKRFSTFHDSDYHFIYNDDDDDKQYDSINFVKEVEGFKKCLHLNIPFHLNSDCNLDQLVSSCSCSSSLAYNSSQQLEHDNYLNQENRISKINGHKNNKLYNMKLMIRLDSQILFIFSILSLLLFQTSQQFTLTPATSSANQLYKRHSRDSSSLATIISQQLEQQQQQSISSYEQTPIKFSFPSARYVYQTTNELDHGRGSNVAQQANKQLTTTTTKNAETDETNKSKPAIAYNPFTVEPLTMINTSQLNAYRYEITASTPSAALQQQSSQDKLKLLHDQIVELRRQLETELSTNRTSQATRQVTIGSPCLKSTDCSGSVARSHCKLDNFTCACLPNHIEHNSTTCLPPSLLGYECLIDSQCKLKVPNSFCNNYACACMENFAPYRKDKCLPGSEINNYCLSDSQCQLFDRHSHCKWKIQNIYGLCKCPPNYMPIQTDSKRIKCAPRLGDYCFDSKECQLTTKNSICKSLKSINEPSFSNSRFKWQSSFAPVANLTSRCFCQDNFKESRNRLECEPSHTEPAFSIAAQAAKNSSQSSNNTNFTISDKKHAIELLERGQLTEYQKFMDSILLQNRKQPYQQQQQQQQQQVLALTTKTTTEPISIEHRASTESPKAGTITNSTLRVRTSSLGKSCSSSLECKLRDKFSDCINGICECLRPTLKCKSNSTGCHKDTFQCRDGQCISWYFVCDKFKNCLDGSDEEECQQGSCPPEAFQCNNGHCLARGKVCNGVRDCQDGSDELRCGLDLAGRPLQQQDKDKSSNSVIDSVDLLANDQQAAMADNEPTISGKSGAVKTMLQRPLSSVNTTTTTKFIAPSDNKKNEGCHPRAFACDNGQCLPGYVFCNAIVECLDGSDENKPTCNRDATASLVSNNSDKDHNKPNEQVNRLSGPQSSLKDSTVIKTDRAAINELLRRHQMQTISSSRSNKVTKAVGLQDKNDGHNNNNKQVIRSRRRHAKLEPQFAAALPETKPAPLDSNHNNDNKLQSTQSLQQQEENGECPNWAFTCRNGRCRSSAILCSGVDGCGDNSDEDRCQVCQCEAP